MNLYELAINRCKMRKTQWLDDLNWADEMNDEDGISEASSKIDQEVLTISALEKELNNNIKH